MDKFARPVDRAINMTFSRQVSDYLRSEVRQGFSNGFWVGDVGANKAVAWIGDYRLKRAEDACIGELVID